MPLSRRSVAGSASGLFAATLLGVALGAADGDDLDTDKWKVVFSDKFDRAKIGDRWKVAHGEWTIEDGALKGRLVKREDVAFEARYADIALSAPDLPTNVEVRYETWSPDELSSEAKFLSEADDRGIVMAFLGVEHPFLKAKGPMVFFQRVKGFQRANDVGKVEFTPKDRHKVRLLRMGESLALYLDGEAVVTADITDAKEFRDLTLHLMGNWGKEGSVIYFDNLEVRVPPDPVK
jgi:hypothetical protein